MRIQKKSLLTILGVVAAAALADTLPPGIVKLKGGTDGTTIGNSGSSLNVSVQSAPGLSSNQGSPAPASSAWPVYLPSPIPSQTVSVSNFPSSQNVVITGPNPLPISGTVTSNIGTTNGLALDASVLGTQGSATGGTAAASSQLMGGVYNSVFPTLSPGEQSAIQLDSSGRVILAPSGADSSTNVSQFGGNPVVTGTGPSGSGIPRFTVSNDSNILASQSGSWTTGRTWNLLNTTDSVNVGNFPSTQTVAGTVTSNQGTAASASNPWPVYLPSPIPSQTVSVSNFPSTQNVAVTNTPTVTAAQSTAGNLNATVFQSSGLNLHVDVDSAPTTTITGAVSVSNFPPTQNVAIVSPSPIPVTGTVTSNIGTTGGLALNSSVLNTQGSATGGTAASSSDLTGGVYNSSLPTLTTGEQSAIQLDSSGRIILSPTVSSSSNIAQFGGNNVVTGTGASGLGIPRVTVANDSNILATQAGTWTNTVTQATGSNLHVDVDAIPTPTYTQSVSGTVTANAGTGTFQTNVTNASIPVSQSGSWINTVTQFSGSNLHTDVDNFPSTQNVSGTVTVAQGTPGPSASPWPVYLPSPIPSQTVTVSNFPSTQAVTQSTSPWVVSGTVTSNVGTTGGLALNSTLLNTQGSVSGGTAASNSDLIGGVFNTVLPTLTNGQQSAIQLDSSGRVIMAPSGAATSSNISQFGGNNVVTGTGASGLGIPRVTVSNDSNILATQSGTWNLNNISGAVSLPTGASTSANQSTEITALNTINTTLGSPMQNSGGSVTANQGGTWNINNISGTVSLPTGASTSANQTTGNTSLASIATNTAPLNLAQGSTTSGQSGNLSMGAVTTGSPVYTTGQTSPLSLSTAGYLRVDGSGVTQPVSGTVTANQGGAPWSVSQSGTWNINNITGTVSLPTGAATAANQATIISTLGSPMQNSGGSVTANQGGTWNVNNVSGTVSLPTGAATSANQTNGNQVTQVSSLPSTPAGTNSIGTVGLNAGSNNIGSITNITGTVTLPTGAATAANQTNASQKTQAVDGSGNVYGPTTTISATNYLPVIQASSATPGSAVPVRSTMVAGSDGTNAQTLSTNTSGQLNVNNISGTVSLPTGAATSALQTSGNSSLSTIATSVSNSPGNSSTGVNGIQVMGVVSTQPSGLSTTTIRPLSLTTGQNLRTDMSSIAGTTTVTAGVSGLQAVGGDTASGTADSGSDPVKIGGIYQSTQTAVTTGEVSTAHVSAFGDLTIAGNTKFLNIAAAATTTVKSGAGLLYAICFNHPVNNATDTIYDNTAASGTKIGTYTESVGGGAFAPVGCQQYGGMVFSTGLTIVTSSTEDITVLYK